MEQSFDFNTIVRVLIVGTVIVASLLKRVGKSAPQQESSDEQEQQSGEHNMPRNIFDMVRENLERIEREIESEKESNEEKRVVRAERPQVVTAPNPAVATSERVASPAVKTQMRRSSDPAKTKPISPIKNGEIGDENSGGILEDFDLRKAVIYHEILTPKFEE